jgi:Tol biopolymer transport system component
MFNKTSIFILLLFVGLHAFSQKKNSTNVQADKNRAKELFDNKNYKLALQEYLLLLKSDSNNSSYRHNAAICYLNQRTDRKKAVKLLEYVVDQAKVDPYTYYDLGRAYQFNFQFDEAIKSYQKFIPLVKKDINLISALRQIEMCENAKDLIVKPINVSFENLGSDINTNGPDYNPFISADESYLVFSSKRNGNLGNLVDNEGFNTSDIFSSENNGTWTKPKRLPPVINSPISDDCSGLTSDGITMTIRYENNKMLGDIMVSELKGKSFLRPMNASEVINTSAEESAACLSPDKQTMFFSSNREGGIGGKDLYYSKRLPSGEWSQAVNLGSNINTIYDEDFPYIAPDGENLYFSSLGHNSMGGFDIFKTKWEKETYTFSEAENIGYPINTPEDEKTISFSASGRFAYYAALRKEGLGDLDIYRIVFNEMKPSFTVISGKISFAAETVSETTEETIEEIQEETQGETIEETKKETVKNPIISIPENIKITAFDKKTKEIKGKFAPNKQSNKYLVILTPGNYILKFEGTGINSFETEINIPNKEQDLTEITKDISLTKSKQ